VANILRRRFKHSPPLLLPSSKEGSNRHENRQSMCFKPLLDNIESSWTTSGDPDTDNSTALEQHQETQTLTIRRLAQTTGDQGRIAHTGTRTPTQSSQCWSTQRNGVAQPTPTTHQQAEMGPRRKKGRRRIWPDICAIAKKLLRRRRRSQATRVHHQ